MTASSYLKRSPTGWYSYRRRIPGRLREILGWEHKARLETKDKTTALLRCAKENIKFETKIKMAEQQLSQDKPLTISETFQIRAGG